MMRCGLLLAGFGFIIVGCGSSCGMRAPRVEIPPDGGVSSSARSAAAVESNLSSAEYFLALGALHERFQDPAAAANDYNAALARPSASAQHRVAARQNLARLAEARGDFTAAIQHLESAMHDLDRKEGPAGSAPASEVDTLGTVPRALGRLYSAVNRLEDAERLYVSLQRSHPEQREEVSRLLVGLWNKSGTLPQHIAESESALRANPASEDDLRFLAMAYSGSEMGVGLLPPAWAPLSLAQADLDKLVNVYERLYHLHPEDRLLRQALINMYERLGRLDDCIRLLRSAARSTAATAPADDTAARCAHTIGPLSIPAAISTEAEVIRVLVRGGRGREARDLTAKLVYRFDGAPGTWAPAHMVAAQLHLEQGNTDLADTILRHASRSSASADDRSKLAIAHADILLRAGRLPELKALLAQWRSSDDACLRAEATRRESMLAQLR